MSFAFRHAARRAQQLVAVLLLTCSLLSPGLAFAAHTSSSCPAKAGTVTNGGTVTIDVTDCSPWDIGFAASGPVDGPALPQYGSANLRISGSNWLVDYSHHGGLETSDVFEFTDASGDETADSIVQVTITILPSSSPITVSPATLPALTAGASFAQTLTSTGGVAPYTYALQGGTLPVGVSLTGSGVISGTPTQRGSYTFSVRSTDSIGQFVDKGYTGTVENPTLALTANSGTAIQGAPFSQTLTTTGGVAPHTYQLETGTFPAGISISSGGVISGTTAAAPGNYPVTLRVTDASTGAGSYFELESYTLTVSPPPSVSIAVAPASVNEDGATNLIYTVTRSLNLSSATTVNISTSGTATAGTDYTGSVATVTIPAGATAAAVTIDPTADSTVEADETVTLTVAAGTGYTVGAPASATGTILNDDVLTATIAVSPAAVAEDGGTNLVYTVTLNQSAPTSTSVNFSVAGTATPGTDYASVASPLVIAAGSSSGTITVNPTADTTIEADETVVITLDAGAGYAVGAPASATGTILNDDLPALSINDVAAAEGNAGVTNFYIANSLTGQAIPAGSSTYSFTVQVSGDTLNEPSETFLVNVTNVVNATVADGQGQGTIVNDDALPSLSIDDASVAEGNSGTASAVFTVTLSAASGQSISVNYATADGTATAPADYTASSGTLTFAPGQTARTVVVPVIGETVPEADETFFVNLSGASNATIADNQGVGTIVNDDVPVTVSPATLPNGSVAVAYSQMVTAAGGTAPYTFAVTAGALPPGLSLSSGGLLSGTSTAGGAFNFTITATDSSPFPGPFAGSRAYALTMGPPLMDLPATTLPAGTLGAAYAGNLSPASGGTAPYSYAVTAGVLPAGLSLDAATGAIAGTPNAQGVFNFTVTATDSSTGGGGPYSATQSYGLTITRQAPVAGSSSLTVAHGAAATNVPLNLSGGAPDALAIGASPSHGSVTVSGLSISYQPDAGYAGADSFSYTASNDGGTSAPATVTVTVSDPTITIAASEPLTADVGVPYTQTFSWSGGTAPYGSYAVANLPAGLSITGTTASSVTVAGIPTAAGSFGLNVSATDSSSGNGPYTVGQVFTLSVAAPTLSVSPAAGPLPDARAGTAYDQTLTVAGGIAPYTATLAGALPAGLAFDPSTLGFSGTPTQSGSFTFTATITDSTTGIPGTVAATYTLAVQVPALSLSPDAVPDATAGMAYSQVFAATGGIAPYQYSLSAGALPAGLALDAATGRLAGTPTEAGSFDFSVTATDSTTGTAASATRDYALTISAPVIVVDPETLPAALQSVEYAQSMSARGGTAPYSFAVDAGALPAGIVLSADGALTGASTQTGTFNLAIRATDALGFSGTRAYALNVIARPDPTQDPEVRGLLDAQAETTRRFAAGQIANFQQRLEQLHGDGRSGGMRNGLSFTTREQCPDNRVYSDAHPCGIAARERMAEATASTTREEHVAGGASTDLAGTDATRRHAAAFGFWTGGTLRSGNFDGRAGRNGLDFETEGVSAGADHRFHPDFVAGAGLGYGQDSTTVGDNGSQLEGRAWTLALYGSYQPGERFFVDGLAGYQRLSYDLERFVTPTGGLVRGSRDGGQWFASLSVGSDMARGAASLTPYARLDVMRATLDRYTEQGDAIYALTYGEQEVDTTTGNLGLRMASRRAARWGSFSPQLRFEYQYDFTADSRATMQYADLLGPSYATSVSGYDRSRFLLGMGVLLDFGAYSLQFDYRGVVGSDGQRDNALQLMFQTGR